MSKISLQLSDQQTVTELVYELSGKYFKVSFNNVSYEGDLELTGHGEGWIEAAWESQAGQVFPFYMTQKQDALHLWIAGKSYVIKLQASGVRRTGIAPVELSGAIKSLMPGTILKVPVKVGEAVEANQPLVIMESMKMEMTLSAPQASTVREVLCVEGQLVEMGALLVKLET